MRTHTVSTQMNINEIRNTASYMQFLG